MTDVSGAPALENSDLPLHDEERLAAITGLESEFGELITHFRRAVMENAERLSPGMLPTAYKAFTTIVRCQSSSASTLAEMLQMDKGQLSRTVRELEELGLIQRTPDPVDRRSTLITPTAEGLERLTQARRPQDGRLLRSLGAWELADIKTLSALLHRLTAATREL